MKPSILIRPETPADIPAISELTLAAFQTLDISQHTEHFIIDALRAAGALTLSLVAQHDRQIVGHLAFSPVTLSDSTPLWFGLGPVSVLPQLHRQGIGSALIIEGLSRLKAIGARGCCLVGHPDYYPRFGFRNLPGLTLPGVPPEVFLAQTFSGPAPQAAVTFHPAFTAAGPQE